MADNRQEYGIRPHRGDFSGGSLFKPEEHIVASAQSFDINGGASNVALGYGDMVRLLSTGGVALCDGAEGAGGALAPYGIVVGVGPFFDGTKMVRGRTLPSDTTYGTNLARQSTVLVVPVDGTLFEADCDDATTATTKAAYQAFIGENVDMRHDVTASNTRPTPRIDISSHATTNTLIWRIVGISKDVSNQDFSGNFVKLIVRCNIPQLPRGSTTGV